MILKNLWVKNLLAEIWHFSTQKYKNMFSQVKLSSFYMWVTGK